MFYYRITVARPRRRPRNDGAKSQTTDVYYREFMQPRDVGEFVAVMFGQGARRVNVARVSQAVYLRNTRGAE